MIHLSLFYEKKVTSSRAFFLLNRLIIIKKGMHNEFDSQKLLTETKLSENSGRYFLLFFPNR